MSLDRSIDDTCPKCHKPIKLAAVAPHPTRRDIEHHNFKCDDCGYVKTKVFVLKPDPLPPEPAADLRRDFNRESFLKGQSMLRPLFANESMPMIILLVEDSPGDIRLILETFTEANPMVRLYVTEDGAEAVAFLRREGDNAQAPRPELILLDLNMPKMGGREVLAVIKSDEKLKMIPTVILTNSAAESDVMESYELQANCYLQKPVQLDVFEDMVKGINDFWLTNVRLPQQAFVA
jgi:two-component system, chemotaxis family, response regulator Rcp1